MGGNKGSLTLILGSASNGSANRSIAYDPGIGPGTDIGELEFRIRLSGPEGARTETVRGADTIRLSLTPGRWTIQADAYYQGVLYAISDPLTVNVSAGGSNSAALQMQPATKVLNEEDFGPGVTPEYRYFSASDTPTALHDYLVSKIGVPNGNYAVIVEGTQHIILSNSLTIASYVALSLRGSGTLKLATNGSMFKLDGGSGKKLILRGPTLVGRNLTNDGANNNASLVTVQSGAFVMYAGEIRGNTTNGTAAGGVYVEGGIFTMSGGSISGNTALHGGGVYVCNPGSQFTMSGSAVISGNTSIESGGGVFAAASGAFTMNGGTISTNTANDVSPYGGGGVMVDSSSFTMSGGTISGNTASYNGGGVCVFNSSTFNMSGGIISGANTAALGTGTALYIDGIATAKWGVFGTWLNTFSSPVDTTIHIVDGAAVPPGW
ncbi:hypothetical protein AGMMS50230_00540 [Spirochaetia bacterium]|nr:hypothetical protein AGMMS50230_00540 [Spirochaetia bacterium]